MRLTIVFTIICCYQISQAQSKYDHQWVFNNHNNLIFNEDSLVVNLITNPDIYLDPGDFATSICDKNGNLLFYTGGCYVLNRENLIMMNGDSITSDFAFQSWCAYNDFPMWQNNTILPYPNDIEKYVIFNCNLENPLAPEGLPVPTHLYYHVVDMEEDTGLGAIVQKKQIIVEDTLTGGYLQAVRHSNSIDWWVIAPEWHSNCYFVIPLTTQGVGNYHRSCEGQVWGNDGGGQTTFSPDGKKYVQCNYLDGLWAFDFDNTLGNLSNPVQLTFPTPVSNYRGVCFSPNSRYLYVASYLQLFQFDMEAADIQASMQLVGELDASNSLPGQGSLAFSKLGPDGKIYIASPGNHRYLSVINKPNCPGEACDFQQWAIHLLAPNFVGLPNLPHFNNIESSYSCETISTNDLSPQEVVQIYPNPFNSNIYVKHSSESDIQFSIYSPIGRLIKSGTLHDGTTEIALPRDLPKGIYYIDFCTQATRNMQKIIKI